ncbi:hypothetical protein L209DRAFT_416514 [Thermothelomyces heterothallicus CBS 203.75]
MCFILGALHAPTQPFIKIFLYLLICHLVLFQSLPPHTPYIRACVTVDWRGACLTGNSKPHNGSGTGTLSLAFPRSSSLNSRSILFQTSDGKVKPSWVGGGGEGWVKLCLTHNVGRIPRMCMYLCAKHRVHDTCMLRTKTRNSDQLPCSISGAQCSNAG